jgi:hypothetical protein
MLHRESPSGLDMALAVAELVRGLQVTEEQVSDAAKFVRARRDARGEPPNRKGPEYVVEALLRPIIAEHAAGILGLQAREDWRQYIYSSHYHTSDELEPAWRKRWREFRQTHPDVDTADASGKSCRADLFIHVPHVGLISVEFKYVAARRTPAITATVKEMRQHLSRHAASVLVLYAARPVSPRLEASTETQALVGHNAVVASVLGPPVEFP